VNDSTILGASSLSPDEFRLAASCVDIWTAPIQANPGIIDQLKQTLSPDELERALRFHAAEHQGLFATSRGILRAILSCYVSDRPESLVFRYGTNGKPHLLDHPNVHFNLGHSGGRAVYAVAGDDLGVDIELIKPLVDWGKISARFFSAREAEELKGLDPARQIAGFFACWTRKEAYIKATGDGLAAGLGKFYAGVDPLQADGTIEEEGHPRRWYFKDLTIGDQYAGAVVTRFEQCRTRSFNFQQTEDCLSFIQRHRALE
jgi:4'-phosphopantetheinyl transferase